MMLINMMLTKVIVAVSTVLVGVGLASYYDVLPVPDPSELLPAHVAPSEPRADSPVGPGPGSVPGGEASEKPASKPTLASPKVDEANPGEAKPTDKAFGKPAQTGAPAENGSSKKDEPGSEPTPAQKPLPDNKAGGEVSPGYVNPPTDKPDPKNECGSGLAEVQQTHQPTDATCEGDEAAPPTPPGSKPGAEVPPTDAPPTSNPGNNQVSSGNGEFTCEDTEENAESLTHEQILECQSGKDYVKHYGPLAPMTTGLPSSVGGPSSPVYENKPAWLETD